MVKLKLKSAFTIMDKGRPEIKSGKHIYVVECSSSEFVDLPDGQRAENFDMVIAEYREYSKESMYFVFKPPYDSYWEWFNRTMIDEQNRYIVEPLNEGP